MEEVLEHNPPTCPHCQSEYVSFCRKISVFTRDKEDSYVGVHVSVDVKEKSAKIRNAPPPNTAVRGRRDSVAIPMVCEQCGLESVLSIVEHKGKILMSTLKRV